MNSQSPNITLFRATEWKPDGPHSFVRVVLAYTGPGHTPLATWDEWYHGDGETRAFGNGHYFLTKEVDKAHDDFQKRRNRFRLKEQIPPDPSGPAHPIGAEALELVKAEADFDAALSYVEERRLSQQRQERNRVAVDDEFNEEDR